jgi:hypothetical protein
VIGKCSSQGKDRMTHTHMRRAMRANKTVRQRQWKGDIIYDNIHINIYIYHISMCKIQKKQGTWKQIYSGWPPDDAEVPITKRRILTVIHIYIYIRLHQFKTRKSSRRKQRRTIYNIIYLTEKTHTHNEIQDWKKQQYIWWLQSEFRHMGASILVRDALSRSLAVTGLIEKLTDFARVSDCR